MSRYRLNIKDRAIIYGENWTLIANQIKADAHWKCQECGHISDRKSGHVLTVHHSDGCPKHNERSNLKADCQGCHLIKQREVPPCKLLVHYRPGLSKQEIDILCHGCKRNRQEYPLIPTRR